MSTSQSFLNFTSANLFPEPICHRVRCRIIDELIEMSLGLINKQVLLCTGCRLSSTFNVSSVLTHTHSHQDKSLSPHT